MIRRFLALCAVSGGFACGTEAAPDDVGTTLRDASMPDAARDTDSAVSDAGARATDGGDAAQPAPTDGGTVARPGSSEALAQLDAYLAQPRATRPALADQAFASVALTSADAITAGQKLWADFAAFARTDRAGEVGASESVARTITLDGQTLRYYLARRGNTASGASLFISMHGGGNAPAATNDGQWENQIALVQGYDPQDAIWVAPRAPIDDWNMWFVAGIDALFERLITDMIVFEGVDPNKVYINGYSAGGDGVYQLGPRMGERWAGAGMSAGHPNAASALSLRNVPFAIHVGGDDTAYDRNLKAREWGTRLEQLAASDPGGYVNQWQVHAGLPHWMDLDDAVSIPFLQSHTRDPIPRKVVWEQAELPRAHFYWLAVDTQNRAAGNLITAHYDQSGVTLDTVQGVRKLSVRLSDAMLDLDQPVVIKLADAVLSSATATRTIAVLQRTLDERNDPSMLFPAEVTVDLP